MRQEKGSSVVAVALSVLLPSTIMLLGPGCGGNARAPDATGFVGSLNADSPISIRRYHQYTFGPESKKYGAFGLTRALLFFELGDYSDTDRWLSTLCREMDQIAGDEAKEMYALTMDESAKVFRGDPYDRATAYFYRGMCRVNMGDWEGALAAFRHSLACDGETRTKNAKEREDFTVSQFMVALCYFHLGEQSNAREALEFARQHAPTNPHLAASSLDNNLVMIIALGDGPYRTTNGELSCGPCPEATVEVLLDGKSLGTASEITDLMVQATSNKRKSDEVRGARQVTKGVLYVATGVMLPDTVDTRYWNGLPRKFMILTAEVPPGEHTLGLKCHDVKGKHLASYDQTWYAVPIASRLDRVFYFRTKANIHDCQGKRLQPIHTEKQGE